MAVIMTNVAARYYDQQEFWSKNFLTDSAEEERIRDIINAIPHDVSTVLDAGCGNGALMNALVEKYPKRYARVAGVDSSQEALKHVKTEKHLGTISQLPFDDSSFDLVICSEVLEHLSHDEFEIGLRELQRVSRKNILITVPNNENLESLLVHCPECRCWFNQEFHVRSFDKYKLRNLFDAARSLYVEEIGPTVVAADFSILGLLYYVYTKKPKPAAYGICPQCGYKDAEPRTKERGAAAVSGKKKPGLWKILVKPMRRIVAPAVTRKRWLLAFYQKSS